MPGKIPGQGQQLLAIGRPEHDLASVARGPNGHVGALNFLPDPRRSHQHHVRMRIAVIAELMPRAHDHPRLRRPIDGRTDADGLRLHVEKRIARRHRLRIQQNRSPTLEHHPPPAKPVINRRLRRKAEEIEINSFPELSPQDVYSCVISLRRRKLPSPVKFGNAGSFFKNPVVDRETFTSLLRTNPSLVSYPLAGGRFKLSAAWLIDNAGLRGYRMGDVGVWEKQPLVLVNYGQATGEEIYAMAQDVRLRVKNCFGVKLEPEVAMV